LQFVCIVCGVGLLDCVVSDDSSLFVCVVGIGLLLFAMTAVCFLFVGFVDRHICVVQDDASELVVGTGVGVGVGVRVGVRIDIGVGAGVVV